MAVGCGVAGAGGWATSGAGALVIAGATGGAVWWYTYGSEHAPMVSAAVNGTSAHSGVMALRMG